MHKYNKISLMLAIIIILSGKAMALELNESFPFNENETYYEFINDLSFNSQIQINLSSIIIDGKGHSFKGQFNINANNVTLQNIRFESFESFIFAQDSSINIINCSFYDSNEAIKLFNSNFSMGQSKFESINTAIYIYSNSIDAEILQNSFIETDFILSISSTFPINQKIILNGNEADFESFFKFFGNHYSHKFNGKEYYIKSNELYETAKNYEELSELLKNRAKNIAILSNITAGKIITIYNPVNIYGKGNYLISNIGKEYSMVLIGDIEFKMDSLNIESNSKTAISSMSANAIIINSSIHSKENAIFQLEGSLKINDSNFYFTNDSIQKTGILIESANFSIHNSNFYNANSGIIASADSMINGIIPICERHEKYDLSAPIISGLSFENSMIIPQKKMIYSSEYDYYSGIIIQNIDESKNCAYPGFLSNSKYPWEIEFESALEDIMGMMNLKSISPNRALPNLYFPSIHNNYSIIYESKNPEVLQSTGAIIHPYLYEKQAILEITLEKNNLSITYPKIIQIMPIINMQDSRITNECSIEGGKISIQNNFEIDENNSILSGKEYETIIIMPPAEGSHLLLKKNGQAIFNSTIDNVYEIKIPLSNENKLIPRINQEYDFYWSNESNLQIIEKLQISIENNAIIRTSSLIQEYYESIKKIVFDYYKDNEKGIIDFSKILQGNSISLENAIEIERNIGNMIKATLPKSIYSKNDWDGFFLMPALVNDYEFQSAKALLAFKIGHEKIDLYSDEYFEIKINGFAGFNAGFENTTGAYAFEKSQYFDNGSDLIIKTNHLSTFFIYDENQIIAQEEANQSIEAQNNETMLDTIILNEIQNGQEGPKNLSQTTGMVISSSISQAEYLNFLRIMLSGLLIIGAIFKASKSINQ